MMRLIKTDRKMTCRTHGDTTTVTISSKGTVRPVCKVCLDEAISDYQDLLVCADCNKPVQRGNGIMKNGVLTPLCDEHRTKRIFGAFTGKSIQRLCDKHKKLLLPFGSQGDYACPACIAEALDLWAKGAPGTIEKIRGGK